MTEIEVAEIIIKQDGDCIEPFCIDCGDCPAERIRKEKGLNTCNYLSDIMFGITKQKVWFENWLNENE